MITDFESLARPTIEEAVSLEFDLQDRELWVYCDHSQLENALLNLVLNARDAILRTSTGDKISVTARAVEQPSKDRILLAENSAMLVTPDDVDGASAGSRSRPTTWRRGYVEFAVSDNGPGMEDEVLRRAADPFFTTKTTNSGTGLGLSMVYGFIRQWNGQLRIRSEVGQGTTVRLLLPQGRPAGQTESTDTHTLKPLGVSQRVLVVEDEEALLGMTRDVLAALGFEVITAASGSAALSVAENSEPIDVMVTDIIMPGGIGGYELATEMRTRYPSIAVVYMSGYAGFSEEEIGAVDGPFVPKPCPAGTLAEAIEQAMRERPGGSA